MRDDRIHLWFVAPLLLVAAIRILSWYRSRAAATHQNAWLTAVGSKLLGVRSVLRPHGSTVVQSKFASGVRVLPVIIAGLFFGGCATMSNHPSGFLESYGQMKPDPKDTHRLVHESAVWEKSAYTGVLIEPTVIRLTAEDQNKVTPQEMTDLAAYSDGALRKAFAKEWKIVTAPEPGTLRVRSAITGVDTSDPVLNVLTSLVICPVDNGGVSMEFEVLDASSGEKLLALAGYTNCTPLEGFWAFSRFGQAHWGIDRWSTALRKIAHPTGTKLAAK